MSTHNPYQYIPADRPRIINWPKVILWTLGILILGFIIVFFILDPLNLIKERVNDLLNQGNNVNDNNNVGGLGINNNSLYDCTRDVYNCANFTTQTEAQIAFDYCKNQGAGDVWGLDNDGDGRVCEGLVS